MSARESTEPLGGRIFVSIAAYRDPDLAATIEDCLAKAVHPERLTFGICWQHGSDESLPNGLRGSRFRIVDMDWRESRGACHARAEIMKLWDGEEWYLQLDSHHRFAQDWDATLLEQVVLTGSAKPVMTTYAAAFSPQSPAPPVAQVTRIDFDRFIREGAILTAPGLVVPAPENPIRARFVSAHFLFAPGAFVREVPYDPELYFIGEEITLAVRAFTHGYDLFHPARHVVWHEYTRAFRPRHWDDHTHERGAAVAWHERDSISLGKVARFLADPEVGCYGIGTVRTLADYEAYAGVNFRQRRVQDYTRLHLEPPNPAANPDWAERVRDHRIEMRIDVRHLPPAAVADPTFWYVGAHDRTGKEIFRRDAGAVELKQLLERGGDVITLVREFAAEAVPASWTVLPHSASRGWLERVTRPVTKRHEIFVSIAAYRDPDLVATVEDCLANAAHPERLVFGICWQHGSDEPLPDALRGSRFRIVDMDWRESRGACHARAEIMKLWDGEEWYLQLDSHHRFAQDWDATLLEQAALTGSAKPLLSAPAPEFTIGKPVPDETPMRTDVEGFRPDGIPAIKIGRLGPEILRRPPIRARVVCGHFLFTRGEFAREVPYDPEMYFSWEEITMALRAFTHGYDLFHPSRVVVWHAYARDYRSTHWDDHTLDHQVETPWHQRRAAGIARVAQFLADPQIGPQGLGNARPVADYEAYAGISFRARRVQDYTRLHHEPPNPPAEDDWPSRMRDRRIEISFETAVLAPAALEDPTFWYVGVHDACGQELYRRDATRAELAELRRRGAGRITLVREFASETPPTSWTVLPHSASAGWLERITAAITSDEEVLRVLSSERYRPYQRVIYNALADQVTELDPGGSPVTGNEVLLARCDVFHLHWPELFLGPDERLHEMTIAALERAGVPVVWTQHNLRPHDRQLEMDGIYQRWAATARGVIHHSHWGERQVRARYEFRDDAIHRVIPHPHFGRLVKRDARTRPEIETALGLRHDVLRLAVIGAPRRERDARLAIDAVRHCRRDDVELLVYSLAAGEEPLTSSHDPRIVARRYELVSRAIYDDRLRVSDALVMPLQPGLMLTTGIVGDAIAHGLPCLVSGWPFLAETLAAAAIPYGETADDLAATVDALDEATLARAAEAAAALRTHTNPARVGWMTLALLREVVEASLMARTDPRLAAASLA